MENLKLLFRAWKYRLADNPEEIRYLLRTIKRGDTVMDVGAHKGGYTFWMQRAVGPDGKVIAFEPQRKGAHLLTELFKGSNVHVEHLALSNCTGQQELYIQPQAYEVSFEASLENKYEDSLTEWINTVTLDHYCNTKGLSPAFIKIDVEGHEEKVLEGAISVLQQARPVLLIECEVRHSGWGAMQRVFRLLEDLLYKGFFYRNGGRTPLDQFIPEQDQRTGPTGTRQYVNNFYFEPGLRI